MRATGFFTPDSRGLRCRHTQAQAPMVVRFQAMPSWKPCLTIPSLSFLICQMGKMVLSLRAVECTGRAQQSGLPSFSLPAL